MFLVSFMYSLVKHSVYAAHTGGILKEKNPIRTSLVPLTLGSKGLSYLPLYVLDVL